MLQLRRRSCRCCVDKSKLRTEDGTSAIYADGDDGRPGFLGLCCCEPLEFVDGDNGGRDGEFKLVDAGVEELYDSAISPRPCLLIISHFHRRDSANIYDGLKNTWEAVYPVLGNRERMGKKVKNVVGSMSKPPQSCDTGMQRTEQKKIVT